MNVCVFCGGLPLTREHVWPQWLQKFSGPQSFIKRAGSFQPSFPQTVVRQDARGKFVEVDEYRGTKTPNLHEVTVKCVCASCNNGWMSAMEVATARHLGKMAEGRTHCIDPATKALLAAWAFKCFLMYDQYRDARNRVFVEDDFLMFMKTKKPARTARIYMGISSSPHTTISMWHETHLVSPPAPDLDPQKTLAQPRNL